MFRLQKLSALVAACLMVSSILSPASYGRVGASPSTPLADSMATITACHGDVFKRDFVDWNREAWGDPEPAKVADQLREGMQIGTGNASWAEIAWPNVKTRAWENTVFAVAPNKRLVYLTGGEMLFRLDKHRKDKDQAYYIWTKVLQARIRGTTVLVQAKGNVSRITVLEGKIDVYNRLDHSNVTIMPGTVFEITGHNMSHAGPLPSVNGQPAGTPQSQQPQTAVPYRPQPLNSPKGLDGLQDITFNSKAPVPLFQDNNARSLLYTANSQSLLDHPLVNRFPEALDSLPLIKAEQANLPGYSASGAAAVISPEKLNQVVFANTQIKGVPTNADYYIGAAVGKEISLPQSAYLDFPPAGMLLSNAPKHSQPSVTALNHPAPMAPPMLRGPEPAFMPWHMTNTAAEVATLDENKSKTVWKRVFDDASRSDPEYFQAVPDSLAGTASAPGKASTEAQSAQATAAPAVIPPCCLSPATKEGALGTAFQTEPSAASPASTPEK